MVFSGTVCVFAVIITARIAAHHNGSTLRSDILARLRDTPWFRIDRFASGRHSSGSGGLTESEMPQAVKTRSAAFAQPGAMTLRRDPGPPSQEPE